MNVETKIRRGGALTFPATFRPGDSQAVIGIDPSTLYRWEKKGFIKLYRRAGTTFAVTQEVVDFIRGVGDQLGD
jgi:predicted site-specific integrase-resolvase